MNELLLNPNAPAHLARVIASKIESSTLARRVVALVAAIAVNVAVLGTLQWTAANARYTPAGEVVITELEIPVEVRFARN